MDVTGRRVDEPRTPKHGYPDPYTWTSGAASQTYEPWLLHHYIERDVVDCESKARRRMADAPDRWRAQAGVEYCSGPAPLYNASTYELPDDPREVGLRGWARDGPDESQRLTEVTGVVRSAWRRATRSEGRSNAAVPATVVLSADEWRTRAYARFPLFGWDD